MLLKCNECGFENQLGAIFCRECGAKLDVEKMRPQVKEKKIKISFGNLARNLLAIAVLGAVAFGFAMMFYPEQVPVVDLDEAAQEQADLKLQALIDKIGGGDGEDAYVFSADEVTYLYNNKLVESENGDRVNFSIDPAGNVVLLSTGKFMGADVSYRIVGRIVDELPELEIISAKMGHLPIPALPQVQDKVINHFTSVLNEGSIKDIVKATENLKIDEDGDFQITVKSLK